MIEPWGLVERAPLALHIGGTVYKVHSSASAEEMTELARQVDEKLRELNPKNRPMTPQMLLLVALAFAHDAGEERRKREGVQAEARDMLRRMIIRIDAALDDEHGNGAVDVDGGGSEQEPTLSFGPTEPSAESIVPTAREGGERRDQPPPALRAEVIRSSSIPSSRHANDGNKLP